MRKFIHEFCKWFAAIIATSNPCAGAAVTHIINNIKDPSHEFSASGSDRVLASPRRWPRRGSLCTFQIISVVTGLLVISASPADDWDEAARRIVRLESSAFTQLPQHIVAELKAQGCTIPQISQMYGERRPHNVISGSFAAHGQTDWAALCSKDGSSSIRIFWGGPAHCPEEIPGSRDRNWLQVIAPGKIGYSRFLRVSAVQPPPIDYDGIQDIFVQRGAVTHYCDHGKWIELSDTD